MHAFIPSIILIATIFGGVNASIVPPKSVVKAVDTTGSDPVVAITGASARKGPTKAASGIDPAHIKFNAAAIVAAPVNAAGTAKSAVLPIVADAIVLNAKPASYSRFKQITRKAIQA